MNYDVSWSFLSASSRISLSFSNMSTLVVSGFIESLFQAINVLARAKILSEGALEPTYWVNGFYLDICICMI